MNIFKSFNKRKIDTKEKNLFTLKSVFKKKFIRNFILSFVIFIILAYALIYRFTTKEIKEKLKINRDIISKSIVNPLYNLDFFTLKNILESYLINNEIYKIKVIDEFNNEIVLEKKIKKNIKLKKIEIDILKDNFKIGKLIIYYNFNKILRKIFLISFAFFFIIVAGFVIFYFDFKIFFTRYLVYPFNNLVDVINSIIKKNYKLRINYNNHYLLETINIAKSFNLMVDEIEKNISELNRKQNLLNSSLENFENIVNNIPDAIIIYNMDTKILYINKKACSLYGYTKEEMLNKSILERSSKDYDINDVNEKFQYVKNNKKELQFEWKAKNSKGEIFPIIVRINYIKYNGQDALLSVITDKTEVDKIRKSLLEAETKYENLFKNLPIGVFYFDADAKIKLHNPGLKKIFSILVKDKECIEILNDIRIKNKIKELLNGKNEVINFELSFKTVISELYFKFILSIIKDNENKIVGGIGIVNNITSERKLEKEYIKASKLESLGILAGGIAHDFNNIFAGIIGNITLAKYLIPEDEELKEVLLDIEDISLKAKILTNQILTFAKGGAPIKRVIKIDLLIDKIINLLFVGSKINVIKIFQKRLFKINADSEQIYNALYNIICNAKEAVDPDNGEIKIEVKNFVKRKMEKKSIKNKENNINKNYEYERDIDYGKYIKIIISDDGKGIKEEYIHKIFDPYFTTKEKGKGIGLAVSYSIIRRHKGYIFCESEPEKGTIFTIYLPVFNIFSEESIENDYNKDNFFKKGYTLNGTVLLMDDEMVIRKTLEKMFKLMGVKTYSADSGINVIKLYKKLLKKNEKIDLVILDLTVPGGLGGKEIIKELKEINPEIKAIISSGYSNDEIMSNYKKYGFINVIKKPYTIDELYKICKPYLH